MVGARAKSLYQAEAKERQKSHGNTAPGRGKTLPVLSSGVNGDARDLVGKRVVQQANVE
jgi:hypothetical protein